LTNQFSEGSLGAALEREHHEIDAGIEAYAASLSRATPDIAALAGAIRALRRHIYLEEEVLFPSLTGEPSLPMAIFVMYREHGEIWREMDQVEMLLASGADSDVLRSRCDELLDLLKKHNFKEEPVIYGKADEVLASEVNQKIRDFLRNGSMPAGWTCKKA